MDPLLAFTVGIVLGSMLGAFVMAMLADGPDSNEAEEVIAIIEDVPERRQILADWPTPNNPGRPR